MNIFTAAQEGMIEAVKTINENKNKGVVECPLCSKDVSIEDPCYITTGWCFDCDDNMNEEWEEMWDSEHAPKWR